MQSCINSTIIQLLIERNRKYTVMQRKYVFLKLCKLTKTNYVNECIIFIFQSFPSDAAISPQRPGKDHDQHSRYCSRPGDNSADGDPCSSKKKKQQKARTSSKRQSTFSCNTSCQEATQQCTKSGEEKDNDRNCCLRNLFHRDERIRRSDQHAMLSPIPASPLPCFFA